MAKKKAGAKKAVKSGQRKKKGRKSPVRLTRPDLLDQNSTQYVVFEDALKSSGPFGSVEISVRAIANSCRGELVDIANFDFSVTYNGGSPFYQEFIKDPGPGVGSAGTLKLRFRPWVDDPNFPIDDGGEVVVGELVIVVRTKKRVRIQ